MGLTRRIPETGGYPVRPNSHGPEFGAAEAASRAGGVVARAVDALDEATVRFAVRDEVAAWALGSP